METKTDIATEKETETKETIEQQEKTKPDNTVAQQKMTTTESTLPRLAPALIVSVSIMLGSGILSATSFANQYYMTPEVKNFYYQLPPPGPYQSNLEMPQPPFTQNNGNQNRFNNPVPPYFRPPQIMQPNWTRPTPPKFQASPGTNPEQQQNEDQKLSSKQTNKTPMAPPPWAQQPPQKMVPPQWAQQPPPMMAPPQWAQQPPPMMAPPQWAQQPPQRMAPPQWAQQPPQRMAPPQWAQQPPQRMAPPQWAKPMPPWFQNPPVQQPNKKQDSNTNLNQDQKSASKQYRNPAAPPMWPQYPQQMAAPGWARPMPPWMQQQKDNTK